MIDMQPMTYSAGAPDWYACEECGAKGVRLYRDYQTFLEATTLRCTACALKNQDRKKPDNISAHSIAWLVAAVPTECGRSYWGFTSVPDAGVHWWNSLPVEACE